MSVEARTRLPTGPTSGEPCREASCQVDEPLAGTAPAAARAFLLLEHGGPWAPREAVKVVLGELAAPARAAVAAVAAREDAKVHLVRRVRPPRPRGSVTVMLARAGETPWLRRLLLPDLDALAGLDLAGALAEDEPPPLGEPPPLPVVLVCTHGKRDPCCARDGTPLARALADDPRLAPWQSSHLGGHRLAATGLFLPSGWMFGRATADDAAALAARAAAGEPPPARLLRGRCGRPAPVQIVEHALLAEDAAAFTHHGPHLDLDPAWAAPAPARVVVRGEGGAPSRVAVVTFAPGPPRPKGCGEDPEPSLRWTLTWERAAPGKPSPAV